MLFVLSIKLVMFNQLKREKSFKLLKVVVDVACKLDIFKAEYVDKLFTFVSVANVDPLTVKDDKIVTLYKIPLTHP